MLFVSIPEILLSIFPFKQTGVLYSVKMSYIEDEIRYSHFFILSVITTLASLPFLIFS